MIGTDRQQQQQQPTAVEDGQVQVVLCHEQQQQSAAAVKEKETNRCRSGKEQQRRRSTNSISNGSSSISGSNNDTKSKSIRVRVNIKTPTSQISGVDIPVLPLLSSSSSSSSSSSPSTASGGAAAGAGATGAVVISEDDDENNNKNNNEFGGDDDGCCSSNPKTTTKEYLMISNNNNNNLLSVHNNNNLLSVHTLPQHLQEHALKPLSKLVSDKADGDDTIICDYKTIGTARLKLQEWFCHSSTTTGMRGIGGLGPNYQLRHIIARNTSTSTTSSSSTRNSFDVQKPVLRFHTDSTHTAFTNIWFPIAYNNYPLGFLFDTSQKQYLTAHLLQDLCTAKRKSKELRNYFQQNCIIVYFNDITYGQAIVFRSGGMEGILHGSFLLPTTAITPAETGNDDDDDGPQQQQPPQPPPFRRSVEFRCQRFNPINGDWIYGDI